MAEFKQLLKVSYVTDTETQMYQMGEISGGFDDKALKNYIERYGYDDLSKHITFLQYQIMATVREVNREKRNNDKIATNISK